METLAAIKTEKNLTIVQEAFQDFSKGNIQGILDICSDDITWGAYHHPDVPFSKTYHGKSGTAEFFATLLGNVDYKRFEPREFYADGDCILVRGYHEGVVKSTGKSYGHEFLMHFKFRNGKVYDYFSFIDIFDEARAFQK